MRLLINYPNIDIYKPGIDGWTPLVWASCMGHVEVCELLLSQKDFDVNKADIHGAMMKACNNNRKEVFKLLNHYWKLKTGRRKKSLNLSLQNVILN